MELDPEFGKIEPQIIAKSSVKLIKNSKGVNWEIKVVVGEEDLIMDLKKSAVRCHNELIKGLEYDEIHETPIAEQNPLMSDH